MLDTALLDPAHASQITLRPGRPADAAAAGDICYRAFATIARAHNFPPDFPTPEAAAELARKLLGHPGFHAVVAEAQGRIVGSNFVDLRDAVAGVGPITVDPAVQNKAVGRRLMEEVVRHAAEQGRGAVRLVQAAYHGRSLSLYAKLGFDVQEPLACLQGPPPKAVPPGRTVRPASSFDLQAADALARRVLGHDRGGELRDAVAEGTAAVVERAGRITGYTTGIGFLGHAVGDENDDVAALIAAAPAIAGPGLLLPTRNTALFRWCLAQGLRVVQPMTLMTLGPYREPAGAFLPSILY
jgi:predicted N-acetyltransferase YhbS